MEIAVLDIFQNFDMMLQCYKFHDATQFWHQVRLLSSNH